MVRVKFGPTTFKAWASIPRTHTRDRQATDLRAAWRSLDPRNLSPDILLVRSFRLDEKRLSRGIHFVSAKSGLHIVFLLEHEDGHVFGAVDQANDQLTACASPLPIRLPNVNVLILACIVRQNVCSCHDGLRKFTRGKHCVAVDFANERRTFQDLKSLISIQAEFYGDGTPRPDQIQDGRVLNRREEATEVVDDVKDRLT